MVLINKGRKIKRLMLLCSLAHISLMLWCRGIWKIYVESVLNGRAVCHQAFSDNTQLRVAGSGNVLSGPNYNNHIFMVIVVFCLSFFK